MKKYCLIKLTYDYEDPLIDNFFNDRSDIVITTKDLMEHLSQWDYGGESEHCLSMSDDEPGDPGSDIEEFEGGYILSVHHGFAYVSLTRIVEEEAV